MLKHISKILWLIFSYLLIISILYNYSFLIITKIKLILFTKDFLKISSFFRFFFCLFFLNISETWYLFIRIYNHYFVHNLLKCVCVCIMLSFKVKFWNLYNLIFQATFLKVIFFSAISAILKTPVPDYNFRVYFWVPSFLCNNFLLQWV